MRNVSTTTATESSLRSRPSLWIADTSSLEYMLGNGSSEQDCRDVYTEKTRLMLKWLWSISRPKGVLTATLFKQLTRNMKSTIWRRWEQTSIRAQLRLTGHSKGDLGRRKSRTQNYELSCAMTTAREKSEPSTRRNQTGRYILVRQAQLLVSLVGLPSSSILAAQSRSSASVTIPPPCGNETPNSLYVVPLNSFYSFSFYFLWSKNAGSSRFCNKLGLSAHFISSFYQCTSCNYTGSSLWTRIKSTWLDAQRFRLHVCWIWEASKHICTCCKL